MHNATVQQHPYTSINLGTSGSVLTFPLGPPLLPVGHAVAFDRTSRVLARLQCAEGQPTLVAALLFPAYEANILLPLLASWPAYCPYEVLIACDRYSYARVTERDIERARAELYEAQADGTVEEKLKRMRNAASRVRRKLRRVNLDFAALTGVGFALMPLGAKLS